MLRIEGSDAFETLRLVGLLTNQLGVTYVSRLPKPEIPHLRPLLLFIAAEIVVLLSSLTC